MTAQINQKFYDAWWSSDDNQFPILEEVIEWSYRQPKDFWDEVFKYHQDVTGLKSQTIPFQSYEFYHDCVIRHLGKRRIAFKIFENKNSKEWSYEFIHRLVNYQVDRWKNYSILPGTDVAIIMPMGINLLVAILTALRLGLRFTFLPVDSPVFAKNRLLEFLERLAPSLIITTSNLSSTLPNKELHWLLDFLEEKGESNTQNNHCYQPADVVQNVVACQSQEVSCISPLSAHDMYLCALRDGFISLGLLPGAIWAYTPRCNLREQPCKLLMALLCGATTVYLPEEELLKNPLLIENETIDVLEISTSLKNLWLAKKGFPKSRLKFLHRHFIDFEDRSWKIFKEKHKLEKVPISEFLFDNSQGGIVISSCPSYEKFQLSCWPALGMPWKLLHQNQSGQLSLFPHGIFQQSPSLPAAFQFSPSNFLIVKLAEGWALGGTLSPNKEGYTIPVQEIESQIAQLPFCKHALLLGLPKSHSCLDLKLVILVFTSPFDRDKIEQEKYEWKQLVNSQIAKYIGPFFIPDVIEFYPIAPRISNQKINRSWCLTQYLNGMLAYKRYNKIYYWLNLLRNSIRD